MSRIGTFTFRINADERRILAALADRLQRSQSDAIRLLIRTAAEELNANAGETAKVNAASGYEVKHAANAN